MAMQPNHLKAIHRCYNILDMLHAINKIPSDGEEEGWQGELRAGAVTSSVSLLLGQGFSFLTAERAQRIMLAYGTQWLP